MKQLVILGMVAWLGSAAPAGLLGEPEAVYYGRLQRNSYVPYPRREIDNVYAALKKTRMLNSEPSSAFVDYEFEPNESPIPVYEQPQEELVGLQFEDEADPAEIEAAEGRIQQIDNQPWLDVGTLYDTPFDLDGLEQQKQLVRQIMSNYIEQRPELRKKASKREPSVPAAIAAQAHALSMSSSTGSSTTTMSPSSPITTPPSSSKSAAVAAAAATATTTTAAPTRATAGAAAAAAAAAEHKEDKVPKASKLHGQKEYAMLRPAIAGEARRPLPEFWGPEDVEVQELRRAARRLLRKSGGATSTDELTLELNKLKPVH